MQIVLGSIMDEYKVVANNKKKLFLVMHPVSSG